MNKILAYDLETTGFWNFKSDYKDTCQPHIVQLAGLIYNNKREIVNSINVIIKPEGWTIPAEASNVHGITTEMALEYGINRKAAIQLFICMLNSVDVQLGHNIKGYDINVMKANIHRVSDKLEPIQLLDKVTVADTQLLGTDICKLPGKFGKYKWPKLTELHKHLFGVEFTDAHDAFADISASAKCYYEMVDRKLV